MTRHVETRQLPYMVLDHHAAKAMPQVLRRVDRERGGVVGVKRALAQQVFARFRQRDPRHLNQSLRQYVFLQPFDLGNGNAYRGWCPDEDFLHQANVLDKPTKSLCFIKHNHLTIEHYNITLA
jgi:hypothetical protein